MKDYSYDFEELDEDELYDKNYIKSSRAKKNYEARKKIEEHMERKRLKDYYKDYYKNSRDYDYELYDY